MFESSRFVRVLINNWKNKVVQTIKQSTTTRKQQSLKITSYVSYMHVLKNIVILTTSSPDSKQSLASAALWLESLATRHCRRVDIGQTLKFQQLKYCCWPDVGPTTTCTHQRCILSCRANELSSLTSDLF